jgi:ribosomal protein L37AE/L43A
MSNVRGVVIQKRAPQKCELCAEMAELRPYGPNGEWVCFPCGMKDEAAAKRAFLKRLEEVEHG